MMKRLRRQRPFLNGILKVANRFKRQDLLQHANKDQINAVSEMVLNLLKKTHPHRRKDLWEIEKTSKPVERSGETQKLGETSKKTSHRTEWKRILEWFTRLFSSMLGTTLKGCDDQGYPLEGIDVVPERKQPPTEWHPLYTKDEETIPALVQLLQDANKCEAQLKDSVEYWNRRYYDLYQDHMALKYGNLCKTCQTAQAITPPCKTITLCRECGEGKKTIQSLKDDLKKKDEEIQYWQDCYETVLKQITEDKYDG